MNTKFLSPKLAATLVALMTSLPANSAHARQSPVDVIRERNETVERIVRDAGDEVDANTREHLKDVINGMMDFRELSRRALGRYWDERTEQERNDFVDVFQQLIRNSSVQKLSIYKADRMEYLDPDIRGNRATVTTIAYRGRQEAEIVYEMHLVNGEWRVYDMVIDGASTVRSYRDSFYRQITRTSYAEMFQRLTDRLAEQG